MGNAMSRYSRVTRRGFLGGLSMAAIATIAGCAPSPSSSSPTMTSSSQSPSVTNSPSPTPSSSPTPTPSPPTSVAPPPPPPPSSPAVTPTALAATAKAKISWTYASASAQKNPYMAVWIEDSKGAFVKTVALFHKKTDDRWLNSLTRWYSVSGATDTTTGGTVPAGTYSASWDGSTASGARAKPGTYFVCIESMLQHGGESLVRQQVTFGAKAAKTALTAVGDITAASVDYTP